MEFSVGGGNMILFSWLFTAGIYILHYFSCHKSLTLFSNLELALNLKTLKKSKVKMGFSSKIRDE
jgi:hypothetical protein